MSAKISGTFTATGSSAECHILRYFNVSLNYGGGAATIDLERSFDDGDTWEVRQTFTENASTAILEPEKGVKYRLTCSAYTSGTIAYRIGSSGL